LFFTSKNSIIVKVGGKITNIKINETNFLQNLQRKENMAEEAVVPATMDSIAADVKKLEESAKRYYKKLADKITEKENEMAEVLTPSMIMGGGGGDGLFGAGGGGLIGGLILGSLLRNNGNLFGGDGAVAGATLRNPPEQNQANMDLMQAVGAVDKSVAVSTAAMEASQATQTLGITSQLNSITQALASRVDGVKDVVNAGTMVLAQQLNGVEKSIMENRYELAKDIGTDGDKTRALITQQYEATLNRQLSDANAAIIALQSKLDTNSATRGVEVTTTNNINQMQQQQQQQQQWGQLYNVLWGLAQNIRSNNEAINVGSGTLTANPSNTNTNIR
jgi:hypothetical protein